MEQPISIELKESASHAFFDVVVVMMGKKYSLNESFTHANHSKAMEIASELQLAAGKVKLKQEDGIVTIRTDNDASTADLFSIDDNAEAPAVIFEHLKSLTNLRGFKIV